MRTTGQSKLHKLFQSSVGRVSVGREIVLVSRHLATFIQLNFFLLRLFVMLIRRDRRGQRREEDRDTRGGGVGEIGKRTEVERETEAEGGDRVRERIPRQRSPLHVETRHVREAAGGGRGRGGGRVGGTGWLGGRRSGGGQWKPPAKVHTMYYHFRKCFATKYVLHCF